MVELKRDAMVGICKDWGLDRTLNYANAKSLQTRVLSPLYNSNHISSKSSNVMQFELRFITKAQSQGAVFSLNLQLFHLYY